VEGMWEHIKKIEKAEQTKQYEKISVPNNELTSYLIQVKSAQPADQEALALQKTAVKFGFESYDSDKIFAKIKKELNELKEAIKIEKKSDIEIEFGNLYFTLLNLARHLNIDPQKALKKTNIKFRNRFANIEENLLAQSKMLTDVSLKEMEDLWNKAKNK
ncbi:MAG: MazG nucleotide pyrophosphohydrolase domain-containing protein, partial [Bartonella sp.]|nr:MazG nucleotide pyrophosphohydrolase domain-containing protein [Bartonella sp.]